MARRASQQWKRGHRAGAPGPEALFVLTVQTAIRRRLIGARDLIIDSAPILAWRHNDPDAAVGHARPLLRGYRVHALLCRGSGLPVFFLLSPANVHDAPFALPLLVWAVRLYHIRPRVIRLDAAYWGLRLIGWIHATLGAVAVVPWNPKRQKNRSCLPPTWTKEELGLPQQHRALLSQNRQKTEQKNHKMRFFHTRRLRRVWKKEFLGNTPYPGKVAHTCCVSKKCYDESSTTPQPGR